MPMPPAPIQSSAILSLNGPWSRVWGACKAHMCLGEECGKIGQKSVSKPTFCFPFQFLAYQHSCIILYFIA